MIVEHAGLTQTGKQRYRIIVYLAYWPGKFVEIGWDDLVPRTSNPIGRAVGRWLEGRSRS